MHQVNLIDPKTLIFQSLKETSFHITDYEEIDYSLLTKISSKLIIKEENPENFWNLKVLLHRNIKNTRQQQQQKKN